MIHQYHARRPTSATRAIILSTIIDLPSSDEDIADVFNLIQKYGLRDIPNNVIYNNKQILISKAVKKVLQKQNLNLSNILAFDPFSGGGFFPLEAFNIGLNSFASDINPTCCINRKSDNRISLFIQRRIN